MDANWGCPTGDVIHPTNMRSYCFPSSCGNRPGSLLHGTHEECRGWDTAKWLAVSKAWEGSPLCRVCSWTDTVSILQGSLGNHYLPAVFKFCMVENPGKALSSCDCFRIIVTLFPGHSHPVFDCLQYANTEGEGLGDLVMCGYIR